MLTEYQSQGQSLTLVKSHSNFKVKTCCLINSWAIWNQNSYESLRVGMKIYTNELGQITNMAAMPIYGKSLKKSSSLEPIDR